MDTYRTEEEQVAAIKKYIGENGTKILIVVLALVSLSVGYRTYESNRVANIEAASVLFDNLQQQFSESENGTELNDAAREKFDTTLDNLKANYGDSIYAVYGEMLAAKVAVQYKDFDEALTRLTWAKNATSSVEIKELANLRLAQVHMAKADYDAALAILSSNTQVLTQQYLVAKGDVLVLKDDKPAALDAYQAAKTAAQSSTDQSVSLGLLDIKIKALTPADSADQFPLATN